jgi:hypothetical protein
MIDITSIGEDLNLFDTQISKAANILSVQVGSLEYEPDFGIDLRFFLDEGFKFQNDSFKAYLIERLSAQGVNVNSVTETLESLFKKYTFEVGNDSSGSGGLITG